MGVISLLNDFAAACAAALLFLAILSVWVVRESAKTAGRCAVVLRSFGLSSLGVASEALSREGLLIIRCFAFLVVYAKNYD